MNKTPLICTAAALLVIGTACDGLLEVEPRQSADPDVVQENLDGIEAMWQKVKDKLSGLTDLIPDWKGPPGVDKRLLTPAGRMIMDGLMDGIDDRFPDLRGQLGDVSGEITKRMVPASLEVRDHAAARSASGPGGSEPMSRRVGTRAFRRDHGGAGEQLV